MPFLRHTLAAAVGATTVLMSVNGVLSATWVALVAAACFILLLPRRPRLVAAAVAGAVATLVLWSVLWTVSWSGM